MLYISFGLTSEVILWKLVIKLADSYLIRISTDSGSLKWSQ